MAGPQNRISSVVTPGNFSDPGRNFDEHKVPIFIDDNSPVAEDNVLCLSNSIRLVAWNANGLSPSRKLKVSQFIDQYQVDVMLLNETHMSGTDCLRKRDYTAYWVNHPYDNARGGVPSYYDKKQHSTLHS